MHARTHNKADVTCFLTHLCETLLIDSIQPPGSHFGAVVTDVISGLYGVNDTVSAVFQSACPRNSLLDGRAAASFLDVEKLDTAGGQWQLVRSYEAVVARA